MLFTIVCLGLSGTGLCDWRTTDPFHILYVYGLCLRLLLRLSLHLRACKATTVNNFVSDLVDGNVYAFLHRVELQIAFFTNC